MSKYNHLTSLNQIDPFPTKLGNKIEQPDKPKTQFHHGQKLKEGFFLTDGKLGYVPPMKYDWEGLKKKVIEAGKNIVLEPYPERDLTGNICYRPIEQNKKEIKQLEPVILYKPLLTLPMKMSNEEKPIDKFYRELKETGRPDLSFLTNNLLPIVNDDRYLFTGLSLLYSILTRLSINGSITELMKYKVYKDIRAGVKHIFFNRDTDLKKYALECLPWIPKQTYSTIEELLERIYLPEIISDNSELLLIELINKVNIKGNLKELMLQYVRRRVM